MIDHIGYYVQELKTFITGKVMASSTETQKAISGKNRLSILRIIRDSGETTRFEIASSLGLSHTTVKTHIEQLLSGGLIEEAGTAPSIGGRKPILIRLIPNSRFSLGANFAPGRIDLILINLKRDIVYKSKIKFDLQSDFTVVLDLLSKNINSLLESYNIEKSNVIGLGMTFPGLVDDSHNNLVYLANLGISNYSLLPFAESIGLKVFSGNEAHAAVNAEQVLGKVKGKENIVYISIAEGIGAGILINGQVYSPNNKNAGEFGHVRISDEPVKCKCGRTGCWEQFASKDALINEFKNQSGKKDVSLEEIFQEFRSSNPHAVSALEIYVRNLFKGIEIVLLAYSPDVVIIGGELADYADEIIDLGKNKLGLTSRFYGYENTKIIGSALKENATLIGAALLPMDRDAFEGTYPKIL
jgi:predicted NBD/HSP70 family sugar kinase